MRRVLAPIKNVAALHTAYEALASRDAGIPGMGLVHGYTGAGKTTAVTHLINNMRGLYVRASAAWTPASMLGKIMSELGAEPLGRSAPMVDHITATLEGEGRPLFVDEADYLLSNLKMLETLRDIHDVSGQPVVLIGMKGIEKKLVHRQQLARRISQWVEFMPADLEDAALLASAVCEVKVGEDLLAHLHTEAKGSVGLMTVGLARIESFARSNSHNSIDLKRWGNRQLFIGGAPKVGG